MDGLVDSAILNGLADPGGGLFGEPVVRIPGVGEPDFIAEESGSVVEVLEIDLVHHRVAVELVLRVYPKYPGQTALPSHFRLQLRP